MTVSGGHEARRAGHSRPESESEGPPRVVVSAGHLLQDQLETLHMPLDGCRPHLRRDGLFPGSGRFIKRDLLLKVVRACHGQVAPDPEGFQDGNGLKATDALPRVCPRTADVTCPKRVSNAVTLPRDARGHRTGSRRKDGYVLREPLRSSSIVTKDFLIHDRIDLARPRWLGP